MTATRKPDAMAAAVEVRMPRLSDAMQEGTILSWLKADGAEVALGEELVEIEAEKATVTHEAPAAGILSILAPAGATATPGEVIARLAPAGSPPSGSVAAQPCETPPTAEPRPAADPRATPRQQPTADQRPAADQQPAADHRPAADQQPAADSRPAADQRPAAEQQPAADQPPGAAPQAPDPPSQPGQAGAPGEARRPAARATALARRLAAAHGVEISRLSGSGPHGRVRRADVERAVGIGSDAGRAPETAPPAQGGATPRGPIETIEPTRLQRVIARRMAESRATIPAFEVEREVSADAALALREQLKLQAGDRAPSFNDLVVRACALALREHPRVNGSYRDGAFELHGRVNVGIAVAAEDALVVATVFDADSRSLGSIAAETPRLAERVRAGSITPAELAGATFTVSNLGMYGATAISPVINPPQAAILGVGATRTVPAIADGRLTERHVLTLRLSCDHRILYGADAARFLATVAGLLERPLMLAL